MLYYLDKNWYFITCRTIDRKKSFLEDHKKQIVLDQLLETEKTFGIKFNAYSIISNHYHLQFYLDKGRDLKKIMQKINGGISFKLNKLNGVYQTLWSDYYNVNIRDESAFNNIMGYILGNPFKHRLVKSIGDLQDYKFCNYREKVSELGKDCVDEIIGNIKNLNWDI